MARAIINSMIYTYGKGMVHAHDGKYMPCDPLAPARTIFIFSNLFTVIDSLLRDKNTLFNELIL